MYAHVTNGTVDQIAQRPPELVFDGTRWWDLRTLDPATLATVGWYNAVMTTRPDNTAQNTSDESYVYNAGVVTQTWTVRPWTAAELTAQTEQSNRQAVSDALNVALADLQALIDTTNATINSNPASYMKTLARAQRRVIRMLLNKFDGSA